MNVNGLLEKLVAGDDYDIERSVPGVPAGVTLEQGWFTIKKHEDDDDAFIQKSITPTAQNGVGHIDDTGVSGTGHIIFQLTASDTLKLTPRRRFFYDIQILTSSGKRYTVELGRVTPFAQITTVES